MVEGFPASIVLEVPSRDARECQVGVFHDDSVFAVGNRVVITGWP